MGITTLADLDLEKKMRQTTEALAALPLEARVNLCAQALLHDLMEVQRNRQRPIGTVAHMTLSLGQAAVATLLGFAGEGAPQIVEVLEKLVQDIKNTEAGLVGGKERRQT